jgi:hypothetical protein
MKYPFTGWATSKTCGSVLSGGPERGTTTSPSVSLMETHSLSDTPGGRLIESCPRANASNDNATTIVRMDRILMDQPSSKVASSNAQDIAKGYAKER